MANLQDLPLELLEEVFRELDSFESVTSLASISRRLRDAWIDSTEHIFRVILPNVIEHYKLADEVVKMQMDHGYGGVFVEQALIFA